MILILIVLGGCSDKYTFLQATTSSALTKVILSNKDSMVIRLKDYSNYSTGGFIRFIAVDSSVAPASWRFIDSSGHLKIFYDSAMLAAPVAVNQYSTIYLACDDTGRYVLSTILTDRSGAKGVKNIPVRVVLNQPPVAVMNLTITDSSYGYKKINLDASRSYVPLGRIEKYLFYVNGVLTSRYLPTETIALYSGSHVIGVKVIDDLGFVSPVIEKTVIVNHP